MDYEKLKKLADEVGFDDAVRVSGRPVPVPGQARVLNGGVRPVCEPRVYGQRAEIQPRQGHDLLYGVFFARLRDRQVTK
jgi:hypothetical protein